MNALADFLDLRELAVDVVEAGSSSRKGAVRCELERNVKFSTDVLESSSFTNWQAVVYDALVVAAAVEFSDRSLARSSSNWGRRFSVRIPVHDEARWSAPPVLRSLTDALNLLTGDDWRFEFRTRRKAADAPAQNRMEFPTDAEAVIAFSEGMDSRAVAGLEATRLGSRLVRVRVGTKKPEIPKSERGKHPFTALPYEVELDGNNTETSARSRGFKFNLVAAIGAYLISAPTVIVPESGQGALAPATLPVGQGYPDYRNHPVLTARMEKFVRALLGYELRYQFPRLWKTKGETLREFVDNCGTDGASWASTWSCWQQSRQASVLGKKRQCGVCAACMLRRMSVHGAGLEESPSTYVWENLTAPTFEGGASEDFERTRITDALRQYALAGVLHLEHFAALSESEQCSLLKRRAEGELARALREPVETVTENFNRLLARHRKEWQGFTESLTERSFVRAWISRS
jgi:hypothetical protein